MRELILYSTLGCHLCELALEEIEACFDHGPYQLKEVDIADDPDLLKSYGTSIPVLFEPSKNKALFWPFDRNQVKLFLNRK